MDKDKLRHSCEHVYAQAVSELYPGQVKLAVAHIDDTGFANDTHYEFKLSDQNFKAIEKKMKHIIKQNLPIVKKEVSEKEAREIFKDNEFKLGWLDDIIKADKKVTLYYTGDPEKNPDAYVDLCKGPHVKSTGEIKAFKLMKVSGAYWRGDENNEMLTRVYGAVFESKEELDKYLDMLEQAKQRDHRKLGKELDLFTVSPLVGAGLPMFTPRGAILRDMVGAFSNQLRQDHGFEKVWIPHITKKELYEKSGHWAKFGDELFLVKSQETSDEFVLKPMNCPHHGQIYASRPRSYKELPVRYLDTTTVYRDEKKGELGGLNRVRSITQDDSHIFCTQEQIQNEIDNLLASADELYKALGMPLRVRLSYRDDSDAYLGEEKLWESAQKQLKSAVIDNGLNYFEEVGEAAFYGPKIDFMAMDAIGREHQVATVQLDFVQPSRFELTYIDADGEQITPVMIHCALLGSIERFLSVYIEHTSGWFPFWAAPEQVRVLTINDTIGDYVDEIKDILKDLSLEVPIRHNDVRYSIDDRNESLGKKIREASQLKIPVQLIVGPKDKDAREVSVRTQDDEQKVKLEELADFLRNL